MLYVTCAIGLIFGCLFLRLRTFRVLSADQAGILDISRKNLILFAEIVVSNPTIDFVLLASTITGSIIQLYVNLNGSGEWFDSDLIALLSRFSFPGILASSLFSTQLFHPMIGSEKFGEL